MNYTETRSHKSPHFYLKDVKDIFQKERWLGLFLSLPTQTHLFISSTVAIPSPGTMSFTATIVSVDSIPSQEVL